MVAVVLHITAQSITFHRTDCDGLLGDSGFLYPGVKDDLIGQVWTLADHIQSSLGLIGINLPQQWHWSNLLV